MNHSRWFGPLRAVLMLAGCSGTGAAQVITTAVGTDWIFPSGTMPAISAPLGITRGVAVDAAGNVYASDISNNIVLRITPAGNAAVVAGNGLAGYSGDGGPATSASLNGPWGIALDAVGNLFISDYNNSVVRRVSTGGVITTVAGSGADGFSGDGGPATKAQLSNPIGLAVDLSGNLFIADTANNRVRKVDPAGVIKTVLGNGQPGSSGDGGPGIDAAIIPTGLAVDEHGNLYIADLVNARVEQHGVIRELTPNGIVNKLPGAGPFDVPFGVAVDAAGDVFVADYVGNTVYQVTPAGKLLPIAGGHSGFSGDGGPATEAGLYNPFGVAVDASGVVYITDSSDRRVRQVSTAGIISTLAGNGDFHFSGDGSPAASATLSEPLGITLDNIGDLFIADTFNNRVRKVAANGIITTVAGTGVPIFSGDGGPAISATLNFPYGVAVDSSENFFIADYDDYRVREVNSTGTITTLGGNTTIVYPLGVAVDAAGSVFTANANKDCIQRVGADGTTVCVAGHFPNGLPPPYFSGDGGPATAALIALPFASSVEIGTQTPAAMAFDSMGNLFIADVFNNRIRKVNAAGIITTVAGNGDFGTSGDGGPAIAANLHWPTGVAVDRAGNLFIADYGNNRIQEVSAAGIMSTIAGNGTRGFAGDGGPATDATLNQPTAVAVDTAGNVYIADSGNNRIREVLVNHPVALVSPAGLQFTASSNGAPAPAQSLSLTSSVDGVAFSATVPGSANWLQLNPPGGTSPRLIQVTADPTGLAPEKYQTTITIHTPYANPVPISVPVTFTVGAGQPPTLSVDKPNLSFPFSRQGSARSQSIIVSNSGGGKLSFAAATITAAGNWLSVSPAGGEALPASPATLTVTADPSGLPPGTYTGQVTVNAGGQTQSISVTMTISVDEQAILLSQTGLSFLGVSQGGVLPPQNFGVLNIGTGVVNWKVSTSTLPPGGTWLNVTPASGATDAAADMVPTVQVSVDAAELPAGTYYGVVRVDAPGAADTPQVVTVVVQVLAPGSDIGAVMQPGDLLFTAAADAESPGSQNLLVYNVAAAPKNFQASLAVDPGLNVIILPTHATLDPRQPTQIVVQPFTSGLATGVHNGVVTLQFSDGRVLSANIRVIVAAAGANTEAGTREQSRVARKFDASAPCTPTKLVLASNTLTQSFSVPAGYPVGLEVNVKDDCGAALTSGSVTASFSNSDPELQLQSLKNGLWNATWQTNNGSESAVTITLQANDPQRQLQGKNVVNTSLTATTDQPVFSLPGVVSAAGGQRFVPVAPGSIISIYGNNLAGSATPATSTPLPIQLADTAVAMAGQPLPLYYASDGQINAQVPFEIEPNATYQLLVLRGNTISLPVGVDVAPAQPAVFTDTSVSPNQGVIFVVRGKEQFEATPKTPASEGDVIVMFCAGLGGVNPSIAAGAPANGQPTAITPTVTIGGLNAAVNFSGLAPGFVGLYQINAVVPKGVPSGNAVPVTIQIAGQTSPQVVMAIQ